MSFPSDSAFGQDDERRRRWTDNPPEVRMPETQHFPPEPITMRTANAESLYHDIDRACSLLEGGGGFVPAGNIAMAREILERLRDDLYAGLR